MVTLYRERTRAKHCECYQMFWPQVFAKAGTSTVLVVMRVPKVWHLSPKSKMADPFFHLALTVSNQNLYQTKQYNMLPTAKKEKKQHADSCLYSTEYSPPRFCLITHITCYKWTTFASSRKHMVSWIVYIWPAVDTEGLIWSTIIASHVSLV